MPVKAYILEEGFRGHREPEVGKIDPRKLPELAVLASGYSVLEDVPKSGVPEGYVETQTEPDAAGTMTGADLRRLAGELDAVIKYCSIGVNGAMELMARWTDAYNASHEKAWGR